MSGAIVNENMNMPENLVAASVCRNASVMSENCNNVAFCGTPLGVSFFDHIRFYGFASYFYCFYFRFFSKCSTAFSGFYQGKHKLSAV